MKGGPRIDLVAAGAIDQLVTGDVASGSIRNGRSRRLMKIWGTGHLDVRIISFLFKFYMKTYTFSLKYII